MKKRIPRCPQSAAAQSGSRRCDCPVKVVDTLRRWYGQRMMGVSRIDMERHAAAQNIDRALVVEQCRQFVANGGGET